jgi:hypothetical protein
MRRRIAALSLLALLIIALGAALGAAARPPIASFVVAGAANVRVQTLGVGVWQISYEAPGPEFEWYFQVERNLRDARWVPPDKWGDPAQLNIYRRASSLWLGYLWERAELDGDRNHARIVVRRWFSIPWERYLDYLK